LLFLGARLRTVPPGVFLCGGVLALSFILPLPRGGAILGMPSPCPFFHLTGLPCPGCGLTRAFVCVAHGHWGEAFRWHPLGPLLFGAAWLYVVGTLLKWRWPDEKRLSVALATALIVCWGLRLAGVFPMPF